MTGRSDNVTFTTEDMNRRTREALTQGELIGADVALDCVDRVLARLKSRDRFRVMSAARSAIAGSLTKNLHAVGRLGET